MSRKVKRFNARLFVSWLLDKIEERGKECVVNDIADYMLGTYDWVKLCEGKTKSQIDKMGYLYNEEWFE